MGISHVLCSTFKQTFSQSSTCFNYHPNELYHIQGKHPSITTLSLYCFGLCTLPSSGISLHLFPWWWQYARAKTWHSKTNIRKLLWVMGVFAIPVYLSQIWMSHLKIKNCTMPIFIFSSQNLFFYASGTCKQKTIKQVYVSFFFFWHEHMNLITFLLMVSNPGPPEQPVTVPFHTKKNYRRT